MSYKCAFDMDKKCHIRETAFLSCPFKSLHQDIWDKLKEVVDNPEFWTKRKKLLQKCKENGIKEKNPFFKYVCEEEHGFLEMGISKLF